MDMDEELEIGRGAGRRNQGGSRRWEELIVEGPMEERMADESPERHRRQPGGR